MKFESTNIANEMTKQMNIKHNFVWDNSFSIDTVKLLISGCAKYLGHVKSKTAVKAIRIADQNFHFGAMVSFMPSDEDETKGSFNLSFTFNPEDIPKDAEVVDISDPTANHIFYQEAFQVYKMNFFSSSNASSNNMEIALIEAAEAIKEYLRANANTDPNLEFDDYFTATVETDGDKNYYAITPAAVIKQYVKDDAAIEEAAAA